MRPLPLRLALTALLSAALAGCPLKDDAPPKGSVRGMTVAGTNGQPADPATVEPTQNLGRFSVAYDIAPGDSPRVELRVRAVGSGEERAITSRCCATDSECVNAVFNCRYTANTLDCGGNSAPTSLTDFFQRNGGLPSNTQIVVVAKTLQCLNSFYLGSESPKTTSAARGVIFR